MTQSLYLRREDQISEVHYPDADTWVMPGVRWGRVERLLTPAFWAYQCAIHQDSTGPHRFRTGSTLREEFAVCMLAGYGVRAEVGIEAAERLRNEGMLNAGAAPTEAEICNLLQQPVTVNGRLVRYRFYRTKSKYLAAGLQALDAEPPPENDAMAFRAWFHRLQGIGPKTASFLTRNWLGSDDVAILDIHVVRACQIAGVFPRTIDLAKNYPQLEQRFLDFAKGLGVRASWLDAIMWDDMRYLDDDIVDQAMEDAQVEQSLAPECTETSVMPSPAH